MKKAKAPETLSELIQELWSVRIFILIGISIGLISTALYTLSAQRSYKVSMIVGAVPALSHNTSLDNQNPSPLPLQKNKASTMSLMNQNMYRTIFRSPRVADMIIKMPKQLQIIAQDKQYGLFSRDPKNWSNKDLSKYFTKKIRITPIQHTKDLLEISYIHPNPDFAKNFLLQLHALTDESIRNDHKKLINDRRIYINNVLVDSPNMDHKKALGSLLLNLEREMIMVNSDRSFAMRIINNPSSSAHPTHPHTKMICLIFIIIGAFIGTLVGFTKRSW